MRPRPARVGLALLFMSLALATPGASAPPNTINHEGLLLDADGLPVERAVTLTVALYSAAEGNEAPLWSEELQLELVDGYYSVVLGLQQPLEGLFDGQERFLGLSVDHGAELRPRNPVVAVPYALSAGNVWGDITPRSVAVGGRQVIDAAGNWVGPPIAGGGGAGYETPEQVLAALRTVDGTGSELDADLLDGVDSAMFLRRDEGFDQLAVDGLPVGDTGPGAVRLGDLRPEDRAVDLFAGGGARLRVTPAGDVGIGTTSPGARLQVNGDTLLGPSVANAVARLQLSEDTGTHPFMTFHENQRVVNAVGNHVHDLGFNAANDIVFKTGYIWNQPMDASGTEQARLTRSGRLGLGTAAPTQRLHVVDSSAGNIGVTIQNVGAGQPQLRFLDSGGAERAALTYVPSDESLRVFLTGANRLWIRADGNVGVGASNPVDPLHVAGSARAANLKPLADGTGSIGFADLTWQDLFVDRVHLTPGAAPDCDADAAGQLYFDAEAKVFRGCDGDAWVALSGGGGGDPGGDGGGGETPDDPALSCKSIKDADPAAGSGLYWLRPVDSTYQAWCDMSSAGGGWTRVGRMVTDPISGYCLGEPADSFNLAIDPGRRAGKLRDGEVRAILGAPGATRELMFHTGQAGRAAFMRHTLLDISHYDTSSRNGRREGAYCAAWTCADGSTDATACGNEGDGCPVVGRGVGGNAKKLYIDSSFGAHHSALHAGGGFCGLDNRVRYAADVYVR